MLNYLATSLDAIHSDWKSILLAPEILPALIRIDAALQEKALQGLTIYPPRELVFNALRCVSPSDVKVVILGQDPYHGEGEAMGLSFSVPQGVRVPPSLRNIFKEQLQDLGQSIPKCGDLSHWARQGVLLLNSVMTVEADAAGSHGKLGWQTITNEMIKSISVRNPGCVFLLWGNWARSKSELIDDKKHHILCAAHPSPLSASRGFMGCRHFSQANEWLKQQGRETIDWSTPETQSTLF
jgi:uracil-DNA glycosylase